MLSGLHRPSPQHPQVPASQSGPLDVDGKVFALPATRKLPAWTARLGDLDGRITDLVDATGPATGSLEIAVHHGRSARLVAALSSRTRPACRPATTGWCGSAPSLVGRLQVAWYSRRNQHHVGVLTAGR